MSAVSTLSNSTHVLLLAVWPDAQLRVHARTMDDQGASVQIEAAIRPGGSDEADVEFMKLAVCEAEVALGMGEVPVGCVFVRDGVVVSRYW